MVVGSLSWAVPKPFAPSWNSCFGWVLNPVHIATGQAWSSLRGCSGSYHTNDCGALEREISEYQSVRSRNESQIQPPALGVQIQCFVKRNHVQHLTQTESANLSPTHWLLEKEKRKITKMWSIHTMDYCSAVKRNEVLLHATAWVNLESMLSWKTPVIKESHVWSEPSDVRQPEQASPERGNADEWGPGVRWGRWRGNVVMVTR